MSAPPLPLDVYERDALAFLEANAERRSDGADELELPWGEGSDDVSVFHSLSFGEERALLDGIMRWQQTRFDAGYGAITWPQEEGGAGLPSDYERAYRRLEAGFQTPASHETYSVTTGLIAPTVRVFGTDVQRKNLVQRFLRAEELCCQLFSEPGAGSDLASLSTKATRDGEQWLLNGQKVWSSGAQFSHWGEVICRSDPDVPKHKGMTAFVIPMDLEGIEIRPIKQMSGGTSFNEVFLNDVRVPDEMRLGDVGAGWKVALTTLGFERGSSGGGGGGVGGSWRQLLSLARWLDATGDPVTRQELVDVFIHHRIQQLNGQRVAGATKGGETPGPEGSIGKLLWTQQMTRIAAVSSRLLGPRITADTGAWGTFAWNGHLLGAPGYRIAGGSDEIQRNIIGERVLGLPSEPRLDRDVPFRDTAR